MPLNLAAGCLGNTAGLQQHNRFDGQFVLRGDVPPHGIENLAEILHVPLPAAFDFVNDHHPLSPLEVGRKHRTGPVPQERMTPLDREFNVLRIMI